MYQKELERIRSTFNIKRREAGLKGPLFVDPLFKSYGYTKVKVGYSYKYLKSLDVERKIQRLKKLLEKENIDVKINSNASYKDTLHAIRIHIKVKEI